MDASKVTETVNEEGAVETKVDTVDYRSLPGDNEGQASRKEKVQVTHVAGPDDKPGKGGGVVAGAAAKVAGTIQSAKEGILGKTEGSNDEKSK